MKRNLASMSKRILAMMLCLAMVLAFVPAMGANAAASEGKTYTVIAGSDFQYSNSDHGIAGGHVRNILATIKNQGFESYDGLLFCGDYSQAFTTAASKEGVAHLKNVINEELPTLSNDHKFFLQGNHDMDEETTDGTLTPSGAHETEAYSVFAINEKDYNWYNDSEATIKATASNLRSYLNAKCRAGYTKPIFIMSHIQLHYSMRTYGSGDGKYANYLFDVLNEAAGNGLNIFFLFGHNHSNGWDDYLGGAAIYLTKGDSILIGQSSTTEFKQETLNFTYMNAGYVGYYSNVNTGAESDLTMSVFRITDDQVTISRYTASGIHDLKSKGVTNAYQNETAYSPDTRVLPSPQTVALNKNILSTSVVGAEVTGEGITSYEVLIGASQLPAGFTTYQNYQIRAKGYTDGNEVTVTLPLDNSFDLSRPVLILDHQKAKTIPVLTEVSKVTFTTNHMGSFSVAQADVRVAQSDERPVPNFFRTTPMGEYIRSGVPYVITDSGLTKESHWVLTGTATTKTVSGVAQTGLALDELANADTSPVWYYDGGYLRFGAMDGPYLNISYTGDYNGDSTVSTVYLGDFDAVTTAKVGRFSTGPSYYMGVGSDSPLYLSHRNSGTNSIGATYAKYNYNVALWYLNEVISSAKLTLVPSQDTVTLKNTILMTPTVIAGGYEMTDYTLTWESGDPSIATVSADGVVTPVKAGQVYIKATLTTLSGNAVEGISAELPIAVVDTSKTDSSVTAWAQFLHQQVAQEVPVAGNTYVVKFYAGGWYVTGNVLHQGDEGYHGLNGIEGLEIAPSASVPEDVWYYDGTHLYSGTTLDPNKCMIYENNMITVGPVTANNQAFVVDKTTYEYWPYISVDAGRLNHYGGSSYNVAGLYSGNNYMCFIKVIPDQKVSLQVTPSKATLYQNETVTLNPTVLVNDAQTDNYSIQWSSSDLCVATVDGQGNVSAVQGGEAIITASLIRANGVETTEPVSVEIPIQVVVEQETADSYTAEMILDRSLKKVSTLESGKPYVITSCLTDNWALTNRPQASYKPEYVGFAMDHFDWTGGEDVWYYIEQDVDGVTKQYLRYGSLNVDDNYLYCDNRLAKLGTADNTLFDSIVYNESTGGFKITYSDAGRHMHQLGGANYNVLIPTSHYGTDTGSHFQFNTIIPRQNLKVTVSKNTVALHPGQNNQLSCSVMLDGIETTDYELQWSCEDSGVAMITDGMVIAMGAGSTNVVASVKKVNGIALAEPLTVTVPLTVEDHSYKTVTVDATCTEDGSITDTCACGNTKVQTIPATGHSYTSEVTAPTCTEKGYTTYTCACGHSYKADEVAALGHKYSSEVTTAAGCETAGVKTFTCSACGDQYTESIPATGHSYTSNVTAPTCTEKGYTTYTCACGHSYKADEVAALGHKYSSEVTTAAGCETAGVKTFTCSACGDQYTESIPATGHSYTSNVTAPTCTDKGYTTYTCACGHSYKADEVAALGHKYTSEVTTAAGCETAGVKTFTCSVCGDQYTESIPATGHSYTSNVTAPTCTDKGYTTYTCACGHSYKADEVAALGHKYQVQITTNPGCDSAGVKTFTCETCGHQYTEPLAATGHHYTSQVTAPTCTEKGYTTYTCACGHSYKADEVAALGHSFAEGICGTCGEADPDYVKPVVKPTLTLKSPTLEFKDMITVNAMFTAENLDSVVEMGMITYTEKVDQWNVQTAAHVTPGTAYDEATGRYIAHSQGINAKYLGDTVYLACYAKLSDGSYVYTKLAPYSPVQYATNQLKNSSDMKLKQLVAAMLNYGAQAQLFFGHNTDNLANATLTDEQKLLPEAYRSEMVSAVPTASAEKQGIFANNKGFAKRYPSISFEGAFCINYFFKPNYAPVGDITLYYWNESDFNAAEVLTKENASGCMTLSLEDSGEYRGDIEGIAAKNLSASVFVAAVYSDGTTEWTSGVLGYSIGAYCGSQISKGADVAALAEATAVYGYHAKAYFG